MTKELEYIVKVFKVHQLNQTWVAKQLGRGWDKNKINRLLMNSSDIYAGDYHLLRDFLDKHNFRIPEDLKKTVLQEVADLNRESSELVSSTISAYDDGIFTNEERADAMLTVALIQTRLNRLIELLNDRNN